MYLFTKNEGRKRKKSSRKQRHREGRRRAFLTDFHGLGQGQKDAAIPSGQVCRWAGGRQVRQAWRTGNRRQPDGPSPLPLALSCVGQAQVGAKRRQVCVVCRALRVSRTRWSWGCWAPIFLAVARPPEGDQWPEAPVDCECVSLGLTPHVVLNSVPGGPRIRRQRPARSQRVPGQAVAHLVLTGVTRTVDVGAGVFAVWALQAASWHPSF